MLNHFNNEQNRTGPIHFDISQNVISTLQQKPQTALISNVSGHAFKAKVIIPNYIERIKQHYQQQIDTNIDHHIEVNKLPALTKHFGINISFNEPTEIQLHDNDMALENSIKLLIENFGAVIIKNAYMESKQRDIGHRNRFPQLSFHIDRNPAQTTHYSLYTRNPFDPEQVLPRTSMTLFIPYLVAVLQGIKEGKKGISDEDGLITQCDLYKPNEIPDLLNSIILPHTWDEPEGTGEISIIDNSNLLHASYYPNEAEKGYRIGVRYVS